MTLDEAKGLGWTIFEGDPPELVPVGGGVFYTKAGKVGAEKVLLNALGYTYCHHVELATENAEDWPDLKTKLLAEIERLEALDASRRAAA